MSQLDIKAIKARWGMDDPTKVICSACGYLGARSAIEHDDCPGSVDLGDTLLTAVDDVADLTQEVERLQDHTKRAVWMLRRWERAHQGKRSHLLNETTRLLHEVDPDG